MGLRYSSSSSLAGPNCFESPDVRVIGGARDIPYTGTLIAVLAPTDSDEGCRLLGLIFDDVSTLIVDCLHSDDEIRAFRAACEANGIERVIEHATLIPRPCPPPTNQLQVMDWSVRLFTELRPT